MTASAGDRSHLLVCFDFEGGYGMPHDLPFDVSRSAALIVDELAARGSAVFFVVDRMVEDHPRRFLRNRQRGARDRLARVRAQ